MSGKKNLVKLTIDGREVQVEEGTLIIKAAEEAGIYIPRFCYHDSLKPDGNCRMCLVEVEGTRKPVPSCTTPVREGMVVRTDTEALRRHRKAVLEFLLTSHPLDCPICDQAGECVLQDYYFEYSLEEARFKEDKTKKPKRVIWGENLIYDAERCILCRRCVRFLREVTGTEELGVFERGDHTYIGLFNGEKISNLYSGNLVDLCPVGAITDRDFRFKSRVWFLNRTPSICPFCSRGCNIEIHTNTRYNPFSRQRVYRIKPRVNSEVNGYWICDEGRYRYRFIDKDRITRPILKGKEISWDEAKDFLKSVLNKKVKLFLSLWMSNEELLFGKELAEKAGWAIGIAEREKGEGDSLLRKEDKNPNRKGAELLGLKEKGEGEVAVVFHFPVSDSENYSVKIGVFTNYFPEMEKFDLILPCATFAEKEGTWTNFEGRVQKFHRAVDPLPDSMEEGKILQLLSELKGKAMSWDVHHWFRRFAEKFSLQVDFETFPSEGVKL